MPAATDPMDPELRDLMTDQPVVVMRLLQSVGVQTCADVRGLWKTAKDFCEEVEALHTEPFDPTTAFQVARAFTQAVRLANEEMAAAVDQLVGERSSSQRLVLQEVPAADPSW